MTSKLALRLRNVTAYLASAAFNISDPGTGAGVADAAGALGEIANRVERLVEAAKTLVKHCVADGKPACSEEEYDAMVLNLKRVLEEVGEL